MNHLTDEQIVLAARAKSLPAGWANHLAACQRCQDEVTVWRVLTPAARDADRHLTGPVAVPAFDDLLGGILPQSVERHSRDTLVRPDPVRTSLRVLRTAFGVVAAQVRLLPRALGPLMLIGLGVALVAAVKVPDQAWATQLFGTLVTLVMLIGVVATCLPSRDPRRELLYSLPVSPGTVFLARLTLVLAVSFAAASVASVLAGMIVARPTAADLMVAWLGPSLLSAAVAVVVSVASSAWLGTLSAAFVWMLGSVSSLPDLQRQDAGVGAVISRIWTTDVWTVGISLILLSAGVMAMFHPTWIARRSMPFETR